MYRFYASADGSPLRLHMHGRELLAGSHFGAPAFFLWSLACFCCCQGFCMVPALQLPPASSVTIACWQGWGARWLAPPAS